MKRALALMTLAAFAAGCRAHLVETHGDSVQVFKTGLEKPGRGGVVKYLANGPKSWKERRRADAEKRMKKFCGGPFTVTEEGPRSKMGERAPVGSKATIEFDQWWYAAFECAGS